MCAAWRRGVGAVEGTRGLGLSEAARANTTVVPGRVQAIYCNGVAKGGIIVLAAYLVTGLPPTHRLGRELCQAAAQFLHDRRNASVIGVGWQDEPSSLAASGF